MLKGGAAIWQRHLFLRTDTFAFGPQVLAGLTAEKHMSRLNPEKLHVLFMPGSELRGPVAVRRYTLTHSDATGELYLTVGTDYDRQQICILP